MNLIRGRVRYGQAPLAGATLSFEWDDRWSTTTTSSNGGFAFPEVPSQVIRLLVEPPQAQLEALGVAERLSVLHTRPSFRYAVSQQARLKPLEINIPPLLSRLNIECETQEKGLFVTEVRIFAQLDKELTTEGTMPSRSLNTGTDEFWFQPVADAHYLISVMAHDVTSAANTRHGYARLAANPEPHTTLHVKLSVGQHRVEKDSLTVKTLSATSESN